MTAEDYGIAYRDGFDQVVRFFLIRGIPYDEAVECVQAAWAKGWENRAQLRDPSRIVPWIISITLNLRSNELRLRNRLIQLDETSKHLPSHEPDAVTRAVVDSVISRCGGKHSGVLKQRYLAGLTVSEIAANEGVSKQAVALRIFRARHKARAASGNREAADRASADSSAGS
jgi:RNA polymerase sigma factor (sigma-70 family)